MTIQNIKPMQSGAVCRASKLKSMQTRSVAGRAGAPFRVMEGRPVTALNASTSFPRTVPASTQHGNSSEGASEVAVPQEASIWQLSACPILEQVLLHSSPEAGYDKQLSILKQVNKEPQIQKQKGLNQTKPCKACTKLSKPKTQKLKETELIEQRL